MKTLLFICIFDHILTLLFPCFSSAKMSAHRKRVSNLVETNRNHNNHRTQKRPLNNIFKQQKRHIELIKIALSQSITFKQRIQRRNPSLQQNNLATQRKAKITRIFCFFLTLFSVFMASHSNTLKFAPMGIIKA